jgi:ParB-like chromosome segregation protein Spo0J
MADLKIERVAIASLVPDPENPRLHDAKNREAIRVSLSEFGQVVPIVVRRENRQIVGGNERVSVMQEMGYADVDVVFVDFDEPKSRALSFALNRTGELGDWDLDILAHFAAEDPSALVGFSDSDLTELLSGYLEPLGAGDSPAPPARSAIESATQGATSSVQLGTLQQGNPAHNSTPDYLASSTKKFEFYVEQRDYEQVRAQLDLVRKREGLASNSDAVLLLLRRYQEMAQ